MRGNKKHPVGCCDDRSSELSKESEPRSREAQAMSTRIFCDPPGTFEPLQARTSVRDFIPGRYAVVNSGLACAPAARVSLYATNPELISGTVTWQLAASGVMFVTV